MASRRFSNGYRFGSQLSVLLALCAALFVGRIANADPLGAGDGKLFRLEETSRFQEGCFEPCMCPIMARVPARGTMLFVYEGNLGGIETYSVRDVNFGVSTFDGPQSITGQGVYRIGSPGSLTVLEHRLELDLFVGDDAVAHFDSGWVMKDNLDRVAITVSINQMFCWDRVIELDASPLGPGDVVRYVLGGESTFQQGCWDPCDCPLGPELAMTGSFDLVQLPSTSLLREFAVLNVDWQVVSPDVASAFRLRGFGLYRIREEFAIEHQMTLSLTVNDELAVTFDSGWVIGGGAFPSIATLLSINGLECFDTALRVVSEPAVELICGGIAGIACPDGQFCKLPTGRCCCDFMGLCKQVPEGCPAVWNPVCGCDGLTYGNDCEADMRGVSIDHYGPCAVDCNPRDDGFGCVEVVCSDIPEIQCLGTVLELDVTTGAVHTVACECLDFNVCHVEFGNASPFAVGGCPDGQTCEVFSTDTDGDGQPDRFTAACVAGVHACCMPDGACFMLTLEVCLAEGGSSIPEVGCDVVFCGPPAEGACCVATAVGDVGCVITTGDKCAAEGGDYLGDGSLCPPDPSLPCGTQLDGACCLGNATTGAVCVNVTREVCSAEGGEYLGDGTRCETNPNLPCGLPDGACCLPTGDCLVLPVEVCLAEGGSPIPDSACDVVDCAPPGEGACCLSTAAGIPGCIVATREHCALEGGAYQGDGSVCPSEASTLCGQVCGGFAGILCDSDGEFCKFPPGTCDWSDVQGICTVIPTGGCPENFDPVCGCDGVTYGNVCESDAAGVSVLHEGSCESRCAATRVLAETDVAYCPSTAMRVRILLDPPVETSALALEDAPPAGWLVSEISHGGSYDAANGKVKWGPLFAPLPPEVSYVVMPSDNEDGIRCFDGTVSLDGVNQAVCGDECVDRECCRRMLADLPQPACDLCGTGDCGDCESATCGDGSIGLCELIGYACRWMRGCNDDLAGMTRAAFIWRNGECYCWNDADQNWFVTDCSPNDAGCCTSSNSPSSLSQSADDPGGATAKVRPLRKVRSAKSGKLTIPIVVRAPASATAMALEFYVPKEWAVVSISDGGGWDGLNWKIKWGPVFDNLSRTLTVELLWIGDGATGGLRRLSAGRFARTFRGTVSFDGVNSRIRVE